MNNTILALAVWCRNPDCFNTAIPLLQELAGLREEVNTVTDNIKAELDQVIQQKNKEIAQLEVCYSVCIIVVECVVGYSKL